MTKNVGVLFAAALVLLGTGVAARAETINERNDKAASQERAEAAFADMAAACGNGPIALTIDWAPLDGYDYEAARKDKDDVVYTMGPVMGDYAEHLRDLCDRDPAYKAAIGQLTAVNFKPTAEFSPADYHSMIGSTVEGSALTITFRPNDQPSDVDKEMLENAF